MTPFFHRTQEAIGELAANRQLGSGGHYGLQPTAGEDGMVIGEVPFDPAEHLPTDIDPLSFMAEITGEPHVREVVPGKPLAMNTVVHHDHDSRTDPRIVQVKYTLAQLLQRGLEDSLPDNEDRSQIFQTVVTGDPEELKIDRFTDVTEAGDNPLDTARKVARLCVEGPTFIMSDFLRLPLEEVPNADYRSTVAIKVNHIVEMGLPAGAGIVSLGGKAEVNTNKPDELEAFNAKMESRHQAVVDRLESVGIAVAQIVFDKHNHPRFGFDATEADQQIAAAVSRVEA